MTAQPDLLGIAELAVILGVTKQRVHQLTRERGFPDPIIRLRMGPVWSGDLIRTYAAERARQRARRCPSCSCDVGGASVREQIERDLLSHCMLMSHGNGERVEAVPKATLLDYFAAARESS